MESGYEATSNNNISKPRHLEGRYGTTTGGPYTRGDNGVNDLGMTPSDVHLVSMEHNGGERNKPQNGNQGNQPGDGSPDQENDHWTRVKQRNRLDTLCVVGFCLALIGFVATFHLQVLPRIPYPLAGNLQDIDPTLVVLDLWQEGVNLIPIVWGVKYIRKIGLVLLNFVCLLSYKKQQTHNLPRARASGKPLPDPSKWPFYILPIVLYHLGFGSWIGIATNYHLPYQTSDLEWVVGGLVLFLAGELVVIIKTFWNLRSSNRSRVVFDPPLVTLEVGEVVSCVGFACFTLTFPACILALIRTMIAVPACMGFIHGKAF